jgi:hypothetical protein
MLQQQRYMKQNVTAAKIHVTAAIIINNIIDSSPEYCYMKQNETLLMLSKDTVTE